MCQESQFNDAMSSALNSDVVSLQNDGVAEPIQ